MSRKASKKRKQAIAELEIQKRNGLIQAIGAIVVFIVIVFVKTTVLANVGWANNEIASGAIWMIAVVFAGIAGMGTHKYSKAARQIREIEGR